MSCTVARFIVIGMTAFITPLTLAGCLAQEADEVASEEVASDLTLSRGIQLENVTCNSGWPGTRGCHWTFFSLTDVVPGSIIVQINGNNGEMGHSVTLTAPRQIDFTASVNEGDAFNPGKNTTAYTVAWLRN